MTARQFKQARLSLGLAQAALAERLGVHVMTVSRWERATVAIPNPVALALKMLVEAKRSGRK